MDIQQIRSELTDIETMTRKGNSSDAAGLSGEILASLAMKLPEATGTGIPELFGEAAVVHVRALMASGEPSAAAVTAYGALMQLVPFCLQGTETDKVRMELLNNAVNGLIAHIERNEPDPAPDVREHYTAVLRYTLSMLYSLYRRVNSADSASPLLPSVYLTLKQCMESGMPVEYPQVNINGHGCAPDDYAAIFGDLIGRLHALGLV